MESLYEAMGMMARCYLSDGSRCDGFVCFSPSMDLEIQNKDYGSTFFLWTWAHLDQEKHQLVGDDESKYEQHYQPIDFREVEQIDAILYSNPRWGGLLYNHFFIDTRPYYAFEEVRHIFKTIWCSGYEEHWYRNVWNILQRLNLTRYTNEGERCEVLFRAVAASMIYEDFCKVYRDELPSYDYVGEIGDDVSELVIGQLYGAKYPGEVVESSSEAIFILANEMRKEVVSAIKSKMRDIDIFAHLICTALTITVTDNDGDEVDFEIESFGDYVKATKLFQEKQFDPVEVAEQDVYSWISEGLPPVGTFY